MTGVILPKQSVPFEEAYMLIRKNLQMLSDAVGTGGGTDIRKAFPAEAAPASKVINCYLDQYGVGSTVAVNCSVIGTANLNAAAPRLTDNCDPIFVALIGSDWWCVSPFIKTRVC